MRNSHVLAIATYALRLCMQRYMELGVGKMVNYTRVVLGRHRSGAIFPMRACPAME